MSKTILVATDKPFAKAAVDGIRGVVENAGYTLALLEGYTAQSDLVAAVVTPDALIVRSDLVTAEVINAAQNLKIVVRAGAGYDNIDCPAAAAKGIVAMNTPGQNANAVGELAFGLMLNLVRKKYTGKSGTELKGKKIGIHAYGAVGRCVATIAKGFGMTVLAYDPFVKDEVISAEGVTPVKSAEELYSACDFVSLHIPANDKTKKSINFELLSKMKKGAALINTARKEVIDEEGLVKMMTERTDFMYGTDVMPGCDAELNEKAGERYFSTAKKMGAQTSEANINAGIAAAKQIVAFFENGDTTFKVN